MRLAAGSSAICTTAPSSGSEPAVALRLLARRAEPATATAIDGRTEDLQTALAELRELARGLHPAVLTERGLVPALQMLATRSSVPVGLHLSPLVTGRRTQENRATERTRSLCRKTGYLRHTAEGERPPRRASDASLPSSGRSRRGRGRSVARPRVGSPRSR
jgi:hypothetical protein